MAIRYPRGEEKEAVIREWLADPAIRLEITTKFLRKVRKSPGGCWMWMGYIREDGYGGFSLVHNGLRIGWIASRLSFGLFKGATPQDMGVLHRCDNPPCVRPDHLFLGTQADNLQDMTDKGRRAPGWKTAHPGVRNYKAVLCEAAVEDILLSDVSIKQLAERYGVTKVTISTIQTGKGWSHVRPDLPRRPSRGGP